MRFPAPLPPRPHPYQTARQQERLQPPRRLDMLAPQRLSLLGYESALQPTLLVGRQPTKADP